MQKWIIENRKMLSEFLGVDDVYIKNNVVSLYIKETYRSEKESFLVVSFDIHEEGLLDVDDLQSKISDAKISAENFSDEIDRFAEE